MLHDLIVFGEDWGGHPTSTQHILKHMVNDSRILWVNSIGLRSPRFDKHDLARLFTKVRKHFFQESKPIGKSGLSVFAPLIICHPGSSLVRKLNKKWLSWQINKTAKQLNINSPVLWISLPSAVDMVGELSERIVIYYCSDDFGSLSGVDHKEILEMESSLIEKADIILVVSDTLAKRFPKHKTHVIPHGVDSEYFTSNYKRPKDMPNKGPIAGFYGSISEWLDLDLLQAVATKLIDWQFVLIGPVRGNVSKLKSLSNVHLLGVKAHSCLPSYLQYWDVSMIPFRNTPQIHYCNPLKLREYIAGGKPIVTTEFPALDNYRNYVRVANTPTEFAEAITQASKESASVMLARKKSVSEETWQRRAQQVLKVIEDFDSR